MRTRGGLLRAAAAIGAVALAAVAGCKNPGYGAHERDVVVTVVPLEGSPEASVEEASARIAESPEGSDLIVPPPAAVSASATPTRGWVVTWSRWDEVDGRERMKRARQHRLADEGAAADAELAELQVLLEDVAALRFRGLRGSGSVEKTWQVVVVTRGGQWRHTSFNATTESEVRVEL